MTVTLVLVVVVVVVVVGAATVVLVVDGHGCPAGLQTSVRISLSVRRGGPDETAFVMILHLPGRLFFFVSRTTTAPSEHVGPAAVTPSVDVPLQRPFTMTFFNPVELHVCGGTTMAGMNGVIATKPMSRMGEFGPEKTSLTAAAIEPCVPSYDCGRAGPVGAPGTVIGPSVCGFVAAMKPAPARLQPSPFWSVNEPDAPAVVGSALRISWLTRSSPSSNVDPGAHMPAGLWPSVQVVDSSGVTRRKWMPFASGLPLPTVRTIFPL